MFVRQWIVCTILGLAVLGPDKLMAQGKPADLPIDPRVQCDDGPETTPQPEPASACPQTAPQSGEEESLFQRIERYLDEWFDDADPQLPRSIALGIGIDSSDGPVIVVSVVSGEEKSISSLPIPCPPLTRLTGCALAAAYGNLTANLVTGTPPADDRKTCPSQETAPAPQEFRPVDGDEDDEIDPFFWEMLRRTKPLGLVPADPRQLPREIGSFPATETVGATDIIYLESNSPSIRGEYPVRADGTIHMGTYGSTYVLNMTPGQVKLVIEHHLSFHFPGRDIKIEALVRIPNREHAARVDGSIRTATFEIANDAQTLKRVDFVADQNADPNLDSARRNCARTQAESIILYVDPAPRRLIIVED